MPLKKQPSNANEIAIYDEALIYQRGEYWQMRMYKVMSSYKHVWSGDGYCKN
jgi:hypothetical protein